MVCFMYPGRFYIPNNFGFNGNMVNNLMTSGPMTRMVSTPPRNIGLFRKITNGIRSVNWGGLLNNANKTLNVVNQTIPLVRQAGPMLNNMKSMVRIAKAFGNETNSKRNNSINNNYIINNRNDNSINIDDENISSSNDIFDCSTEKKEVFNDNVPNFFV